MSAEYGYGLLSAPDEAEGQGFRWFHVRPGDQAVLVLGEKLPMWYKAHWFENRMQPCKGDGCKLCEMGLGRQRRWVFCVVPYFEKKPYLWECGEAAAMEIRGLVERYQGQADLKIRVSRKAGNAKARLEISSDGFDQFHQGSGADFPEPDQALELTWAVLESRSQSRSGELSGSRP